MSTQRRESSQRCTVIRNSPLDECDDFKHHVFLCEEQAHEMQTKDIKYSVAFDLLIWETMETISIVVQSDISHSSGVVMQ